MSDSALRLIFSQWQGGESSNIAQYVHELAPHEAAQGYVIGSQLLSWLAPSAQGAVATVPVSMDRADTATEDGVFARAAIQRQLRAALDVLAVHRPERIVTLGGECSVSVAPFSCLAARYPDDVAVVWLDAHPDLTLPHDGYTGFHAMALAALLGRGDPELVGMLPAFIDPSKALLVGLRSPDPADASRPARCGVRWMKAETANRSSDEVLAWVRQSGAGKVLVHLDLDVLDPRDLIAAVAHDADGLRLDATIRLINDLAEAFDLVGLTIAEPMPREVIKLHRLLHSLPLLRGREEAPRHHGQTA
ncbi:MAG: arginase family protein [Lautropia sp.]|nr:arginase family protein [Lautropia sp.]